MSYEASRLAGRIDRSMQQQHPSYHQLQQAVPQGYRSAVAEPSSSSLDQQERDSVFKRLGIATDAEFESEQKQSRATLLRDQQAMRGGGAVGSGAVLAPGGPGGAGGYSASAVSAHLYNGGQAAAASTFARAPSSNPNAAYISGSSNRVVQRPDHTQQRYDNPHLVHRNQESYNRSQLQQQQQYVGSSLGAGTKPGVLAAGGGGPSSGSTSAASRSGGSSSSSEAEGGSDVLQRLGLCSNEEYERQSRAELTDAVRSLRGMQERLGNGLL